MGQFARRYRNAAARYSPTCTDNRDSLLRHLFIDSIRPYHVAVAVVAQHAFRMVVVRHLFLERGGGDGIDDGAHAPSTRGRDHADPSRRAARPRQDGVRLLDFLDLSFFRSISGDLVWRPPNRDVFPGRPSLASPVDDVWVAGPVTDLGGSLHGFDERADQAQSCRAGDGCRAWTHRRLGS